MIFLKKKNVMRCYVRIASAKNSKFETRYEPMAAARRVDNRAAHTTRVWTAALRAVSPVDHTQH